MYKSPYLESIAATFKMGSYTYVVYDFRNNDFKIMIAAFDEQGNLVKSWVKNGVRYITDISIDRAEMNFTFTFLDPITSPPLTMDWSEFVIEEISLEGVGIDVASNQITGTTSEMQYSLDSTNGTDGTWTNASATTTPVTFIAGDVYVRQTALPSNFRKISTIAAAATAPTVTIAQGTDDGTIKLTGLLNDVQYEYVVDANPTLAGNASAWSNLPAVTSTEIDNIVVAENQYVHVRVKATANALASEVQSVQVGANHIRSYLKDVAAEKAALTLPSTGYDKSPIQKPKAVYGTTITWEEVGHSEVMQNGSKTAYGSVGVDVLNVYGDKSDTITFRATIKKGNITETKEFIVTIGA